MIIIIVFIKDNYKKNFEVTALDTSVCLKTHDFKFVDKADKE
jgi:hypothetical protein